MVGGNVKGCDPLSLHMPQEVHQVAAIRLDRVVRQKQIADPRHSHPGGTRGLAAGGLQRPGQERLHLGSGRGIVFQEVGPLGHEGAGRAEAASVSKTAGRLVVVSIARCSFSSLALCPCSPAIVVRMSPSRST